MFNSFQLIAPSCFSISVIALRSSASHAEVAFGNVTCFLITAVLVRGQGRMYCH